MKNKNIILAIFLVFSLASCGSDKETPSVAPQKNTAVKLRVTDNSQSLEKTLKTLMLASYGKISPPIMTLEATNNPSYSNTNTQEQGIDEADRLKNDANTLYVASSKKSSIRVFSIIQKTKEAVLSNEVAIDNKDSRLISGLYLYENQLLALSGSHNIYWDQWFNINYWSDRATQLDLFNRDKEKLIKNNSLKIDGELINSRKIGSNLYLVTRHTPSLKGLIQEPKNKEQVAKNRQLINAATLSDFLPNYRLNGKDKGDVISPSNCFKTEYDLKNQQVSLINIVKIDLHNSTKKPVSRCFIGSTETVYVSNKSIYLATTQYQYTNNNNLAVYNTSISTDIHKFSLANSIDYKGSVNIEGHLGWLQDSKSFRMGEFQDKLRVITYTGNHSKTTPSPAKLFILEEDQDSNTGKKLKILATLPNAKQPKALGKLNEQIYAVRFLGDRAYLVTFKTTDPLYLLDLSNPKEPRVSGELEMKGYSDYIHPISKNLILGIGKDALPNKKGEAWYQGVKLTLIDVSNPASPYTRTQTIIGKRGTNTAVSYTHHAFTSLMQPNGDLRIALPISVHENIPASENDTIQTQHQWRYDALYHYNINTVTGELGRQKTIKAPDLSTKDHHSINWSSDRSAIIGDHIYYLHGDAIQSKQW
ncbi:MAG: beta-propeller domain-containing protein [Cocleimonas sp.]|nr:beta-propeller domain-containing protein [Cocleimonas sp.]